LDEVAAGHPSGRRSFHERRRAMAAGQGDPEACVADCTNKLGAFAPSAAKINC